MGRAAAGRPPGADGNETRAALLDAALEAFAEAGYEAMSVRALTRRLGVSHTLITHYFGSKQKLWQAAVDHGFGEAVVELRAILEESTGCANPVEVFRMSVRRGVVLLSEKPAVARILGDESARGGERLAYLWRTFLEPGVGVIERFLAASRPPDTPQVDLRISLLFIIAGGSALFTHQGLARELGVPVSGADATLAAQADSIADLTVNGLFGALSPGEQ